MAIDLNTGCQGRMRFSDNMQLEGAFFRDQIDPPRGLGLVVNLKSGAAEPVDHHVTRLGDRHVISLVKMR